MEKSHLSLLFERGVQTLYTIYIEQHCIWRVLANVNSRRYMLSPVRLSSVCRL